MAFEEALATWLVKQRWFAGKGRGLEISRSSLILRSSAAIPNSGT